MPKPVNVNLVIRRRRTAQGPFTVQRGQIMIPSRCVAKKTPWDSVLDHLIGDTLLNRSKEPFWSEVTHVSIPILINNFEGIGPLRAGEMHVRIR